MPLTTFDFQQARVKQVLFKSQLRSVLYGVREAEPALFSYSENPLAQWLQTVVKPELGFLPAIRELERTLQQMLLIGQELVTRYGHGDIEKARTGLDQINTFADQIEAHLLTLESSLPAEVL